MHNRHKGLNIIPLEFIKDCFSYDADTGELLWKNRPLDHFYDKAAQSSFNKKLAGKQAGTYNSAVKSKQGFVKLNYQGKQYLIYLTSLIYYIQTGVVIPNGFIVCDDDDYENLTFRNLVHASSKNRKAKEKQPFDLPSFHLFTGQRIQLDRG